MAVVHSDDIEESRPVFRPGDLVKLRIYGAPPLVVAAVVDDEDIDVCYIDSHDQIRTHHVAIASLKSFCHSDFNEYQRTVEMRSGRGEPGAPGPMGDVGCNGPRGERGFQGPIGDLSLTSRAFLWFVVIATLVSNAYFYALGR